MSRVAAKEADSGSVLLDTCLLLATFGSLNATGSFCALSVYTFQRKTTTTVTLSWVPFSSATAINFSAAWSGCCLALITLPTISIASLWLTLSQRPSQAMIRKSSQRFSFTSRKVGSANTNDSLLSFHGVFMSKSPNARVTARLPQTRPFVTLPPLAMMRFFSLPTGRCTSVNSTISQPLVHILRRARIASQSPRLQTSKVRPIINAAHAVEPQL
mmetsp:Transcript_41517/g.104714  ORF Transcript_41517/g.104714 Transcript_41517/m.104714 type:complete len:215 (+) Transcript_41517:256-900(+)